MSPTGSGKRHGNMLSPQEIAHFETFGYLFLPQLFPAAEMEEIRKTAEEIWSQNPQPITDGDRRLTYFVERSEQLTRLVEDERIYRRVGDLMGPGFIWVGSEGNVTYYNELKWHSDRKYYRREEERWMGYAQMKVMLYLDRVTRHTGCMRVIPGSHRMPLHRALGPQEIDPDSMPFGVTGPEIPCVALESKPGDVILFNHCIWHAMFGGGEGRCYIALKFAAKPTSEDHLRALEHYTKTVFDPHPAFLDSDSPRLRNMVQGLAQRQEKG